MDSVLAGLLKVPFFSEVAPQTLVALAAKSTQRTYPKQRRHHQ